MEDLVMAAILDGYKKADAVYQEKMSRFAGAAGGMGGLFLIGKIVFQPFDPLLFVLFLFSL